MGPSTFLGRGKGARRLGKLASQLAICLLGILSALVNVAPAHAATTYTVTIDGVTLSVASSFMPGTLTAAPVFNVATASIQSP